METNGEDISGFLEPDLLQQALHEVDDLTGEQNREVFSQIYSRQVVQSSEIPVKTSFSTQPPSVSSLPSVSRTTLSSGYQPVLGFSTLQQHNGSTLSVGFNNDVRTCNPSSSFMTAPSLVSTNGFINTANNISSNRYQGPQPLPSSNIFHNIPVSQKPLCTTGLTSFSGSQGGNGLLNSSVILVPTLQTDGTVSYSLQTQVKLSSPIKPCPILPMLSLPHQEKTGEITVNVKPRQPALILPKFPPPSGSSEMMLTLQSKITPNRIQIDSKLGLLDNHSGSLSQIKRENEIPSGDDVNILVPARTLESVVEKRSFPTSFTNFMNQTTANTTQTTVTGTQKKKSDLDPRRHITEYLPKKYLEKPQEPFSVASFVREMSARGRGKGKAKNRGRPRKGMPKRVNEKKIISDLKKELGLREERVKEFGFIEVDTDLDNDEEETVQDGELRTGESIEDQDKFSIGRTRSGRLSLPPKRIRTDMALKEDSFPPAQDEPPANTGAVTNMNFATPPLVDSALASMGRRSFAPPPKYICKICGKLYLGDKKIARHLKHFPDHEFATPETPASPVKKSFSADSWINESDPASLLDLVGPKLLQSFTLWDLLVKRVSLKRLGTAEVLSSMFADVQALVMDLKNMVEQCLTNIRTNEDSFSVILSPMISSILGQSQNGGVERYVLPYNQIPVHYHKLLGFPMGFKSTHPSDIFSPDSTNSIFHPEEENSQMSISSETNDRPLVDKVVLEANLGTAAMDEDTQDSSRMQKRRRIDSESRSVSSIPPQTPDFLNHEDESNLSSTSNLCTKDIIAEQSNSIDDIPVKQFLDSEMKTDESSLDKIRQNLIAMTTRSEVCSGSGTTFSNCSRTRLPSFSSIMCGSPNPSVKNQSGAGEREENKNERSNHHLREGDDSILKIITRPDTAGGSAPVSPRVNYVSSLNPITTSNIAFQRRSSVDQVLMHSSSKLLNNVATTSFSPGKGLHLEDSIRDLHSENICGDVLLPRTHSSEGRTGEERRFSFDQENDGLNDISKVTMPSPVTSPFQSGSDNAVFNVTSSSLFTTPCLPNMQPEFLETPPKHHIIGISSKSYDMNDEFLGRDLKTNLDTDKPDHAEKNKHYPGLDLLMEKTDSTFYKYTSLPQNATGARKLEMRRHQDFESSTQVTYSELNHPIPSVSPMKETNKDYECSKPRQIHPISQSPNLFNDLESVLNDSEEFSFHSALSNNVENVPVKTPEKLLTSVPPSVIMIKKSSLFDSFEFDKPVDIENLEPSDLAPNNVQQSSAPPQG